MRISENSGENQWVIKQNKNNNKFLYNLFHNIRLTALYDSALVIGQITFFESYSAPWEVYNLGNRSAPKAFL